MILHLKTKDENKTFHNVLFFNLFEKLRVPWIMITYIDVDSDSIQKKLYSKPVSEILELSIEEVEDER